MYYGSTGNTEMMMSDAADASNTLCPVDPAALPGRSRIGIWQGKKKTRNAPRATVVIQFACSRNYVPQSISCPRYDGWGVSQRR